MINELPAGRGVARQQVAITASVTFIAMSPLKNERGSTSQLAMRRVQEVRKTIKGKEQDQSL